MPTPEQLRAARALKGISQSDLAAKAGVSSMTIKRAEGTGKPYPSTETIQKIQRVLEDEGITFISENGEGVGVSLEK